LITEGREFGILGDLHARGVDLAKFLCMVLYFEAESYH
jgi:hypothetical protein